MPNLKLHSSLIEEEKRTLKWFITLFFLILVGYDLFYYYFYKKYILHVEAGLPTTFGLGYVLYIIMFSLIPLSIYLSKKNKQHLVKYIVVIAYLVLWTINDIVYYSHVAEEYRSGNLAEMFVILFSPIFVNIRFFRLVTIGTILKYLLTGAILQSTDALFPISLTIVFALIAYIFLNRFRSYIDTVKSSYDKQLEGIVKGVIAALELKDPYTRGHSERVARYALSLAKEVNRFSEDELKYFNYACLLHDIGKVNIPDRILMKPTGLTDDELDIIKSHPVVGAEAVMNVEGLNENIAVIRSHHERWDGTGYPDQLKGETIPLVARIVAVADAFDAMTSSRSYRSALPVEVAYTRINEGKGTQFDPDLVKLFNIIYPTWLQIHKSYN